MLFRIDFITTDRMTVEAASEAEAQAKADKYVEEFNAHHHHGEKTTATVTYVPYENPSRKTQ